MSAVATLNPVAVHWPRGSDLVRRHTRGRSVSLRVGVQSIKQLPEHAEQMVESRENLVAVPGAAALLDDDDDDLDPYRSCRVLGKRVYKNAAPFLRITAHDAIPALESKDFEVQNDMRIFPDDVDVLMEMARVSLDKDPDDLSLPNPAQLAVTKHEGVRCLACPPSMPCCQRTMHLSASHCFFGSLVVSSP